MRRQLVICLALLGGVSCGSASGPGSEARTAPAWPIHWERMVGKVITVEGSAVNAKLGAMLLGDDDQTLWIDGLQSWPEGFYQGGQRGRRVRVTGTVVSRDDVPVVREGDEPIAQGVPVPAGTDMEAARLRYLLIDASWTPVD